MTAAQDVGVRELRGKLSDYLRRVAAGERFDVVMRGKKIAELRAPADGSARQPGALKGKIWMADDFDEWLPEIGEAFDGDIFPK